MSQLKLSHLVAHVANLSEKRRQRVIGFASKVPWNGGERHKINGTDYVIRQCDSPLAIRETVRGAEPESINIFVTGLDDAVIGLDVMLRLASSRLLKIDRWQIVKDSFHALSIDPRVTQHGWMADLLIDLKPPSGFPPVPGGFLDAETVWPILLREVIQLPSDSLDLRAVLNWSTESSHISLWLNANEEFRLAAKEWIGNIAGATAELVLDCVTRTKSTDVLALVWCLMFCSTTSAARTKWGACSC